MCQATLQTIAIPRKALLALSNWLLGTLVVMLVVSGAQAASSGPPDAEYLIDIWGTEQGLPENSATAMVQTADGYLWFGTFNGLVQFDGVTFKVFDPTNTPALPSAGIVNLFVDSAERMWVSTFEGVAVNDRGAWRRMGADDGWVGDVVVSFAQRSPPGPPSPPAKPASEAAALKPPGDGDILVTTANGHILVFDGNRFTELPRPPIESRDGFGGYVDDESGRWGIANAHFDGVWDGERWQPSTQFAEGAAAEVLTARSRDGGRWFLRGNVLRRFRQGREVEHIELPPPQSLGGLWSMFEDSRGHIWMCTHDRGLYRISRRGEMRRWGTASGLGADGFRFVFEDRERTLWVGASGGGLMRFRPRRARAIGPEHGLAGRIIHSVSAEPLSSGSGGGDVWAASYDKGLFRLGEAGATAVALSDEHDRAIYAQSVFADRSGRVWVGTFGQGLWRIESGAAQRIPDAAVGERNVLAIFEDSRGRVWFGGGHFIAVFESGQFRVCAPEQGFVGGRSVCFAEHANGEIWFSNERGVFRVGDHGANEVLNEGGQPIQGVVCVSADPSGRMWLGARTDGLWCWRDGRIGHIDALPARGVYGLMEDAQQTIWMATERGVIRAERNDAVAAADGVAPLRVQLLDHRDGLPTVDCSSGRQPMLTRDSDGRIWVATPKGLAVIDPSAFDLNSVPPPMAISEVTYVRADAPAAERARGATNGTEHRLQSPFDPRTTLPAGSRQIEIHYAALSFAAPEKVRYQIMLDDGQQPDWEDVGDRRVVHYHELPPREYVFRVRAANNDGVWNETGASLAFAIEPYVWQTMWFRGVVGAGALSTVAGFTWFIAHARGRRRRQAHDRFRLIVEAAPNAMIVIDRHGVIDLVNRQAEGVFGYARDEMIGRSIEVLIPKRFRGNHPEFRESFMRDPHARAMGADREIFGLRKDGSEVPIEIGLNPIEGLDGASILASITDLNERRRAEMAAARQRDELAHLSRVTMLGQLSASIAHELNQPLTAILSNAQAAQRLLTDTANNSQEFREILADIVADDTRAGDVIHRMRALFRKSDLAFEAVDLRALIAEVVHLVQRDASLRMVHVSWDFGPGLAPVRGDRVQLQQVILNLLLNALDSLQHASQDRRIIIAINRANEDHVRVSVSDTGPGLTEHQLEHAFKPFFTTKSEGLGMGLSISRSIVEVHAGTLRGENNPRGGATFWFDLPLYNAPVAAATMEAPS